MENWVQLQDFPSYSISSHGRVRNNSTNRLMRLMETSRHPTVGMFSDGVQFKRSVAKLVCQAFISKPNEDYDTPIHLNGDVSDCNASNLRWRPRWFANKFGRQFKLDIPAHQLPIRNTQTREIFTDAWEIVMRDGLIYNDIILSCHNGTSVFPTMEYFEWVY